MTNDYPARGRVTVQRCGGSCASPEDRFWSSCIPWARRDAWLNRSNDREMDSGPGRPPRPYPAFPLAQAGAGTNCRDSPGPRAASMLAAPLRFQIQHARLLKDRSLYNFLCMAYSFEACRCRGACTFPRSSSGSTFALSKACFRGLASANVAALAKHTKSATGVVSQYVKARAGSAREVAPAARRSARSLQFPPPGSATTERCGQWATSPGAEVSPGRGTEAGDRRPDGPVSSNCSSSERHRLPLGLGCWVKVSISWGGVPGSRGALGAESKGEAAPVSTPPRSAGASPRRHGRPARAPRGSARDPPSPPPRRTPTRKS